MEYEDWSREQVATSLTYDEVVIMFGCLVEATNAFSPGEFRARIGRSIDDAISLRGQFGQLIDLIEDSPRS